MRRFDSCRGRFQDQAERLRNAEKKNSELQGAFDFDGNLSAIEARILAANPLPPTFDAAEPF